MYRYSHIFVSDYNISHKEGVLEELEFLIN